MFEDNELEQIKLRKIQAMLNPADDKKQVGTHPLNVTDGNFDNTVKTNALLVVDFWAPWCRPCMDEMSNSKLLQKKYADENVAFIYLGFKCTEESWKTTIAQLRLTGIHYRLTDQQCDDYSKIFDFTGIPFYIIINKDGVVIDKNAPRPSDQVKLTTILDNLVK